MEIPCNGDNCAAYELLVATSMIPVALFDKTSASANVRERASGTRNPGAAHWWVFTIAVRLILPALMASLRTGATLHAGKGQTSSPLVHLT